MRERPSEKTLDATELYHRMDKRPGAVDPDELWEIAIHFDKSNRPEDLEIASSILVESVLFTEDTNNFTEDNALYWLNLAEAEQQIATATYWEQLESHFRIDQTTALRSEVRETYFDIYRDLARGEITERTRHKTYEDLARIGKYTHKLSWVDHDEAVQKNAVGLYLEIALLMCSLKNGDNNSLLLPSSIRAGSGWFLQSSTHDFEHIVFEGGAVHSIVPVELKSSQHFGDDDESRLARKASYHPNKCLVIEASDLGFNWERTRRLFSESPDRTSSVRKDANGYLGWSVLNWIDQQRQAEAA